MKYQAFLDIAEKLNRTFQITPLLFGSLGLERRLQMNLSADDIDILIPQAVLTDRWDELLSLMLQSGYTLYDLHEHAFEKDGLSLAFASLENLEPFAGVCIGQIPAVTDRNVHFLLLDLVDYLKVYEASSKDGYRKNVKNKQDQLKINLINAALMQK